jgi:hypothetical protein
MHSVQNRPACQKVNTPPFQLPGAGSAQDELQPERFHTAMDLVHQGGDFLYFIENNQAPLREGFQFVEQQGRITFKSKGFPGVQKIIPHCIAEVPPYPGTFPRSPGT